LIEPQQQAFSELCVYMIANDPLVIYTPIK